jgi:hypothetical protein
MSLSGRTPEIEKSGATASSAAAPGTSSARHARRLVGKHVFERAVQTCAAATIASAPPASDHTASATASTRSAGSDGDQPRQRGERDVAETDVERVAGRMRLMERRIEVAKAEREVDRVDVFE